MPGLGRFIGSMSTGRFYRELNNSMRRIARTGSAPLGPYILALLILALSGSLASVDPAFSYDRRSFLWKVQSGRSTVYLLGSIHFLKQEVYPLSQAIEDAYESSDKLVVEANINDLGSLDLKTLADRAFYKNNDGVEKHVAPETYRLIKKESKALGMPIELVRTQKPWFLGLSFQAMELLRLGYAPQHGVDYHFLSKARGKKRILELESLEEQLSFLSGFSDREQEQFLLYTLNTLSSMDSQVESLVRAWRSGDAQAMQSILSDSTLQDADIAPLFRKLFDERNAKMTLRIEEFLNSNESYFVIVGAGHLIGDRGIVEILKRKGFVVEQL